MQIEARGHPLHSRAFGFELSRLAADRMRLAVELIDLRKRGFVPVAGGLQPAGIVHQMAVELEVDCSGRRLLAVALRQPRVAFEATLISRGESCRDPADRLQELCGDRIDAQWARGLARRVGGVRSCTHVISLLQIAGAGLARALEHELLAPATWAVFGDGARALRWDLVFDGFASADGGVQLLAQSTELALRAAGEGPHPLARLARVVELRAEALIDTERGSPARLRAAERVRRPPDAAGAWRDFRAELAPLQGLAFGAGVSARLVAALEGRTAAQRLLELLLQATPAYYQCLANRSEEGPYAFGAEQGVLGMGGPPDSCYMWRQQGALHRLRTGGA